MQWGSSANRPTKPSSKAGGTSRPATRLDEGHVEHAVEATEALTERVHLTQEVAARLQHAQERLAHGGPVVSTTGDVQRPSTSTARQFRAEVRGKCRSRRLRHRLSRAPLGRGEVRRAGGRALPAQRLRGRVDAGAGGGHREWLGDAGIDLDRPRNDAARFDLEAVDVVQSWGNSGR